MSEHDPQPSVAEQLRLLQDQMKTLADRLASIEKRLPAQVSEPDSAATAPGAAQKELSPPAPVAPWLTQPPHAAPSPPSAPPPSAGRGESGPQSAGTAAGRPDQARRAEVLFDLSSSTSADSGQQERTQEPKKERASSAPMGAQQWETL